MQLDILGIVLRWMHILAAMALVGGTLYQRFAYAAACETLSSDERTAWFDTARRTWSKVVMVAILFLLVSGLTNLVLTIRLFKAPNPSLPGYYHAVFGIKFLLALAVFFLTSALAGRGEGTRKFRENAGKWLTVNLVTAIILVCLSGVLRQTHTGPNISPPPDVVSSGGD